jgi:hypothetical protein
MSARRKKGIVAANDNDPPRKSLRAVVEITSDLPVQIVEVEVIAQLLEALGDIAANDNEEQLE